MKIQHIAFALGLLVFAACKKDSPTLSGGMSESAFSYEVRRLPGGDTLPFNNQVVFTNSSKDAFSYLWDFGDANQSVLQNPVHVYGTGSSFTVRLTSIGKAGNNTSSKAIALESPCDYQPFSLLTACGNSKWSMSPVSDAIRILSADGTTEESVAAGANCQTDDVYTFSVSGALNYDSKGQSYNSATGACVSPMPNATRFYMIKSGTANPRIVFDSAAAGATPFFGTTDAVVGNSYEVLTITDEAFVVQGTLLDGRKLQVKFVSAGLSVNSVKLFLTGGSRKTWRLDSTAGARTILAGIESNPSRDYDGGQPLAVCQKDDWYTFTSSDSLIVECHGSTLQPSQGYTCGADQSFKSTYTFGPVTGGVAGAAAVGLAPNNPYQWIGVFDRAPENVYRILEISNSKMLLRSGNGMGSIHTMKFVVK